MAHIDSSGISLCWCSISTSWRCLLSSQSRSTTCNKLDNLAFDEFPVVYGGGILPLRYRRRYSPSRRVSPCTISRLISCPGLPRFPRKFIAIDSTHAKINQRTTSKSPAYFGSWRRPGARSLLRRAIFRLQMCTGCPFALSLCQSAREVQSHTGT